LTTADVAASSCKMAFDGDFTERQVAAPSVVSSSVDPPRQVPVVPRKAVSSSTSTNGGSTSAGRTSAGSSVGVSLTVGGWLSADGDGPGAADPPVPLNAATTSTAVTRASATTPSACHDHAK
jgi:hypothetical protein